MSEGVQYPFSFLIEGGLLFLHCRPCLFLGVWSAQLNWFASFTYCPL